MKKNIGNTDRIIRLIAGLIRGESKMFFSKKEIDPICKMTVNKDVPYKSDHKGKTYYFCALNCKQEFDKNPEKYAK